MSSQPSHSAVGPALGYYYQAIYALRLLLVEENDGASIAIETWDDVVLEKGAARELHQLKHTIDLSKTIGIKSAELWRTLTVWLDYISSAGPTTTLFFLATVAKIQKDSELLCLRVPSSNRAELRIALDEEAQRVLNEVESAKKAGKPQAKWPHAERSKDCARYLAATGAQRNSLLRNWTLLPGSFSIADAQSELASIIRRSVPASILPQLTKQLLAWWDREVLETLTGERTIPLLADEVKSFITKRAADLLQNGFFEDTESFLLKLEPAAPAVQHQLDFIKAEQYQRTRSITAELLARAQRSAWMDADFTKAEALRKYDKRLIDEWSYRFTPKAEKCKDSCDEIKEAHGRELLDWSHMDAPLQVRRIDPNYDNLDLARGTYIYLSGRGSIGWHPDYVSLLNKVQKTKKPK